nr:MAG TPA: protein of unknown function DUF4772 [Caudoviricetes sp.]
MLVNVRYYKPKLNGYCGNSFTYRTKLPLVPGNKVLAPTQGGDQRALVVEADVPESRVDMRILPLLKEITRFDTEATA